MIFIRFQSNLPNLYRPTYQNVGGIIMHSKPLGCETYYGDHVYLHKCAGILIKPQCSINTWLEVRQNEYREFGARSWFRNIYICADHVSGSWGKWVGGGVGIISLIKGNVDIHFEDDYIDNMPAINHSVPRTIKHFPGSAKGPVFGPSFPSLSRQI